jgi:hypothetical protein
MGAEWVMRSRMTSRFSGRKMAGSVRLVKRRVFDGGVGGVMAGRLERSRERFERFDRREAEEADRECCGEVSILNVVVVVIVEWKVSRAAVVGWL